MLGLSIPHLVILAAVVLLLFGRGRVSEAMGDFGKGIREFRRGIGGDTRGDPLPDSHALDTFAKRDGNPDSSRT